MSYRRVVGLLSNFAHANSVIKMTFKYAHIFGATPEILYVHESKLFKVPDYFESISDKVIDLDKIKDEIKRRCNEIGDSKPVAIYAKLDDTLDQIKALLKDDVGLVITTFDDKITPKLAQKSPYSTLVLKDASSKYDDLSIVLSSTSRAKECINKAKELFGITKPYLIYDYRYIIDPSMEMDVQNIQLIMQASQEAFDALKNETKCNGEFFVDGSFMGDSLADFLNKRSSLVYVCESENSSMIYEVVANFKGDLFVERLQGEKMKTKSKESMQKAKDAINELDIHENEKALAVQKIEEWYVQDKGMELLNEQLNSISKKIIPILEEIGLI